jgi:hypothetical protein
MDIDFIYRKTHAQIQQLSRSVAEGKLPLAKEVEQLREDVEFTQKLLVDQVQTQDLDNVWRSVATTILSQCSQRLSETLSALDDLASAPAYDEMEKLIQLLELFDPDVATKRAEDLRRKHRQRDSRERVKICQDILQKAISQEREWLEQAREETKQLGQAKIALQIKVPALWEETTQEIRQTKALVLPDDNEILAELERQAQASWDEARRRFLNPTTHDKEDEFGILEQEWAGLTDADEVLYYNEQDNQALVNIQVARKILKRHWEAFVNSKILEYIKEADSQLQLIPPNPEEAQRKLLEIENKSFRLDLLADETRAEWGHCQKRVKEEFDLFEQMKRELEDAEKLDPLKGWQQLRKIQEHFARYWAGETHPQVFETTGRIRDRVRARFKGLIDTAYKQLAGANYDKSQDSAQEVMTFCGNESATVDFQTEHDKAKIIKQLATSLPNRLTNLKSQLGQISIEQLKAKVEILEEEVTRAGISEPLKGIKELSEDIESFSDTESLIRRLNEFQDSLDNRFDDLYAESQKAYQYLEHAPQARKGELDDAIKYVQALAYLASGRNLPESDLEGRKTSFETAAQHSRCKAAADREMEEVVLRLRNNVDIDKELPSLESNCNNLGRGVATLDETWQLYSRIDTLLSLPSTRRKQLAALRIKAVHACQDRMKTRFDSLTSSLLRDLSEVTQEREWLDRFKRLGSESEKQTSSSDTIARVDAILIQWEAQALERKEKWQQAAESWRQLEDKQPQGEYETHQHPAERAYANDKQGLWIVADWSLKHTDPELKRKAKAGIEEFLKRYQDPDLLILSARLEDSLARDRTLRDHALDFVASDFKNARLKAVEALRIAREWENLAAPLYEQERWAAWQNCPNREQSIGMYSLGSSECASRVANIEQQLQPIAHHATAAGDIEQIIAWLTYEVKAWRKKSNGPRENMKAWDRGPEHIQMAATKARRLLENPAIADWAGAWWDRASKQGIDLLVSVLENV